MLLQTGLCVHFLQRRRQESLRINFSGRQFLGPSGSNEVYIRNAQESKDGAQIRCDKEYENGEKAGPSLGLPAASRLGMTGAWRDELAATKWGAPAGERDTHLLRGVISFSVRPEVNASVQGEAR